MADTSELLPREKIVETLMTMTFTDEAIYHYTPKRGYALTESVCRTIANTLDHAKSRLQAEALTDEEQYALNSVCDFLETRDMKSVADEHRRLLNRLLCTSQAEAQSPAVDVLAEALKILDAKALSYGTCATFAHGDERQFFKKMQTEIHDVATTIRLLPTTAPAPTCSWPSVCISQQCAKASDCVATAPAPVDALTEDERTAVADIREFATSYPDYTKTQQRLLAIIDRLAPTQEGRG